ncbi:MAG: FAD-binding oxidoreductase [Candidatus Thorarchaeota archaeon]
MLRKKQLQELADIVGEDFFSSEEYMRKLYSHDIAALPGLVKDILNTEADAVAQPTSTQVVSNLLKYCGEQGIPVVPRGHGTSGYGGALPTKGGLVVEMTRMNEILHIDRDLMTVEVGAGIIWGNLLERLEEQGLTLTAYPSSAPSSTVGGWVAAGGTGIGSTKYGGIRNQVVDLEVVLADGTIIRTRKPPRMLGQTAKSDYSYYLGADDYHYTPDGERMDLDNLTPLFVDSNGALGIITKVVLKLIPLRELKPLVASFRSRRTMLDALNEILQATRPYYLHFITDSFHQMLEELEKAPPTSGQWVVLSAYEGTEQENEAEAEKFRHFVKRHNGIVEDDEIAQHEWDERFYPMRIKRLGPSLAPSEVFVPIKRLDEFFDRAEKHFKREKWAAEGAVSVNGEVAVLAWFLDDERRKISFLMGWYRSLDFIDIGVNAGGRAYSIGMWNVAHSRSFFRKRYLGQMAKLKRTTDPKGSLNPHKVFPGPLVMSIRFNLLILLAAAIAFPVFIWLAWLLVPTLMEAYVPWLIITDEISLLLAGAVGLVVGEVLVEFVNVIPISTVLSIGRPFLRFFRRIFS